MSSAYSSRAITDTTCLLIPVPKTNLERLLAPLGLELVAVPGASFDEHPVWLDLGHIKAGAGEALNREQHAWWRRGGETLGAAVAWASGAALAFNRLQPRLETLGGDLGEHYSRALSRTLGTYLELLVAVPNVVAQGRHGDRYCFVLGMHTNNPIAIWGDRALGYGYQKRLSRLDTHSYGSYEVTTPDRRAVLLAAKIEPTSEPMRRSTRTPAPIKRAIELISQPLLGHLGSGRFARSRLERDYFDERLQLQPCSVELTVGRELAAGLPELDLEVSAFERRTPWGAFWVTDVPTRVTFPEPLQASAL